MAITPRILFTQPAPAAVAAITLLGLSVLATSAIYQARHHDTMRAFASPCADLRESFGPQSMWNEAGWVHYASCFEAQNDSAAAALVAKQGLTYFSNSQPLYNIAGYNLIEAGEYREAARTLERGLGAVDLPTSNGVMENNLAWSYLWIGQGHTDVARGLYLASLDKTPFSCETMHTGLMVEFERARSTVGLERAEALRAYQSLRTSYAACEDRENSWENLVETTGVGVLDVEIEEMLDSEFEFDSQNHTVRNAARRLEKDYGATLAAPLCAKAIPMSDLRDDCVRALRNAAE